MTFLTGNRQRLEVQQAIVAGFHGKMARGAGHSFMAAGQGKSAVSVVVEFFGKPIDGHMATVAGDRRTVGRQLVGKLAPVDILVAAGALLDQSQKSDPRLGPRMTFQAVGPRMLAFQDITRMAVVEGDRSPAGLIVTGNTTPVAQVLVRLSQVRVLVAGRAGVVGRSEIGSPGFAQGTMAKITSGGQVSPPQRKGRFLMPFQRIPGRTETFDRVTILTPHQAGFGQSRAAVGIAVAIVAGGEPGFLAILGMTLRTCHTRVPTEQRIPGF